MSFPFLPRQLAQKQRVGTTTSLKSSGSVKESNTGSKPANEKVRHGQSTILDDECLLYLKLTLSDYTLSKDADLRSVLLPAEVIVEDEGYIPLSRLVNSSIYFKAHPEENLPPPAMISRLLKAHFKNVDIRMRLSEPSTSLSHRNLYDGFEVKCGGWRLAAARNRPEEYWEDRTVYVENIPPSCKTVSSIHQFLTSIDAKDGKAEIQSITFPEHHSARAGEIPRNKGFAFVVFSEISQTRALHDAWPWDISASDQLNQPYMTLSEKEAVKYGFKSLPLFRWTALRDEYLTYQKQLLEEVQEQRHGDKLAHQVPSSATIADLNRSPGSRYEDSFPKGCLVFVRNLDSSTNKTTLRALMEGILNSSSTRQDVTVDYIDYQKGLDSCHVRLTSPQDAQILCKRISATYLLQSNGLDDKGVSVGVSDSSGSETRAISAEVVTGSREEIYWQKIPEKIRLQALQSRASAREASQTSVVRVGVNGFPTKSPHAMTYSAVDHLPWYPPNCLVFVRNIHPATNKTTLRNLLSSPFRKPNVMDATDQIGYVDYQKGLDTCHVRFDNPAKVRVFIAYFSSQLIKQVGPLDDIGHPSDSNVGIEVELLSGKREEIYWEKIPEKVRRAALEVTQDIGKTRAAEEDEGQAKPKRRKH